MKSYEQYLAQQKRDAIKAQKCKERNTLLIVMPYWIPRKNWEIEIKNQIQGHKS